MAWAEGHDSSLTKVVEDAPPAAVPAVVGLASSFVLPADGLVVVSSLTGEAKARDAKTGWHRVRQGDVLHEGEEVFAYAPWTDRRRFDQEGTLELRINGSSFLRLPEYSNLQLVRIEPAQGSAQKAQRYTFNLQDGRVWVNDVRGPAAGTALIVRSDVMEVAANGAQFQLMLSRDRTETMRVRNYAGTLTATLTDTLAKQTLTPGMQWDVPLRGMWPRPSAFDIAEDEKDPWVARNRQLDATQ